MSSSTRQGSDRKRVVLSAENLEDRTVPAGNVSAFVSGGVLQVTGDAADNRIWVMGLGNGTAIVAPLDNTTINGVRAPQILGGIAFAYNVQLGDGNDFLYITNTSGGSSLFVNMGNGNDGLAVDHAKNSGANYLATGTGNDVVSVGMGKLSGFTTFDLGQGSNRMNVAGTEFGGVAFRGGSAVDSLGLLGVNFRSVPITSGFDRVYSTLTPVANNDRAAVRQNSSVRVNVAANDSAPGNSLDKASIQITRQPTHGTVSVNGDGTVTYNAGNTSATSDSFRYTIRNSGGAISNEGFVSLVLSPINVPDMTSPIPTITNTGGNSTNLASIPFKVTFNEDVTGFVEADLAVTNGTISNFVAVNARTYTFNVAPNLDGTVTVSVAAGAAKDAANNNSVAATRSITSDRTAPTVSVTGPSSPTSTSPIQYTVQFSEGVTGFTAGDILVTNGAVSSFTAVDADTYNFSVVPNGTGVVVSVSVPASATQDAATNGNAVSNTVTVTFSGSVVTATIAAGPTVTNPTNLAAIPMTITFSEDVSGFDETDLNFINGTLQAGSFTPVDGHTFTFNLVPTANGPVSVVIPAGAATGGSVPTSAASFDITSDRTAPTVAITTTASAANPSLIPVTVTFNEDVTDFVVGDVTVTGGVVSGFTAVNARTYTFTITPSGSGDQITVNIAAGVATDTAGNTNTAAPPFTSIAARTDAGMTDTLPNANAANWQTTASGLKKWIIQAGTGPAVVSTSNLGVFYTGWLLNGTVFDSARTDGAPALFPLTNLIPGWKEGLLGMQPGGILRLYVPANLAYGSAGQGSVPPNSDLIFELKLVSLT